VPAVTIEQTFAAAIAQHKAGRLVEADALYRQVLAQQPDHADVLHLAGVVAYQLGRLAEALERVGRAIALKPKAADFHCNQGMVQASLGRAEEAVASFQRALALKTDYPEAHFNLGMALKDLGRLEEAIAAFERAIELRAGFAEASANLGMTLLSSGRVDEAIAETQRWIAIQPDNAAAHHMLSVALLRNGRAAEAIEAARRAVEVKPDRVESHVQLGEALRRAGRLDDAAASFRQALALRPDHPEALNKLGDILVKEGQIAEALECFEKSLSVRPDASLESKRLFTLWFDERRDMHAILQEHRQWNDRHARPLAAEIRPHANDRTAARRLRIGYACPFLIDTPVAWNLLPLITNHDRQRFEVYCFNAGAYRDEMTDRIESKVDMWRDIFAMSDEKAAELIRADGIDILIDLSLHTASNRLLVFARKPAPVQVTYLGYCGTTGLDAMDYRLSDPYFDPPDDPNSSDSNCYSERTVLLPHAYWSYEPGGPTHEPTPLPALNAGCVTFGSLNHPSKVSRAALSLWARVLAATPGSRMLIHTDTRAQNDAARLRFATAGIAAERIKFLPHQSWAGYVRTLDQIDIALDTLPYGGGIAACDALWMGVPVVTLIGHTPVGRGAFSILSNIGLTEFAAREPDDYVRIATELSADPPRLAELRAGLRQRMERSPLRDTKGFVRDVEAAYRDMWQRWCNAGAR
jgi:protein O-GlcNAc transferase